MTHVTAAPPDAIRVILCLKFDHRAAFDEVMRFKRRIIEHAHVLHSIEAEGDFDFLVEAEVHDLSEYQALVDRWAEGFARLVERHDVSFVCRRHLRDEHRGARWLWVPCPDGRRRIEAGHIDRILAEGDYVRLYCGDRNYLLHATMNAIEQALDPHRFVRLHRSAIVRRDLVERLAHRDHHWTACLSDGGEVRISRSHLAQAFEAFRNDWAMDEVDLPNDETNGRRARPTGVNQAAEPPRQAH